MNKHLFSVALLLSTLNACASEQPAASADAAATLACANTPQVERKHHKAGATRRTHNNDEDSAKSASQSFREQDEEEGTTGSSTASSGHTSPAPQAVNLGFAAASSDSATADDTVVTAAEALAAASTSALPADAALTPEFVDKFQTLLTAAHELTTTPADGEIDLDAHDAQDPKTEKVD